MNNELENEIESQSHILREEKEKESQILEGFIKMNKVMEMCGLPLNIFLELASSIERMFYSTRRRGPLPKISMKYSLFLLLCTYRSGDILDRLSAMFRIKKSTLDETISRTRSLLNSVLLERWGNLPKPVPLGGVDNALKNVGLTVDCTSFQVYRPTGRFEEAKKYFDYKNSIYALKKEIAVMPKPPYFALFYSSGDPGCNKMF